MTAHIGYEALIGRWFASRLVPALGDHDIPLMFRGLETCHPGSAATDPSIAAGGPVAAALAPFGVTPVTFAIAARALADLARAHVAGSPPGTPVALRVVMLDVPEGALGVPPQESRLRVAQAIGTEREQAHMVADIVILAAGRCQGVIGGFRAEPIPGGALLREDRAVVAWTDPASEEA